MPFGSLPDSNNIKYSPAQLYQDTKKAGEREISSLFIHLECKFCTCFELNDLLSSDCHLLASCRVTTFASSTL